MIGRHPSGWEPWTTRRSPSLPGLAPVVGHRGAAGYAPENTLSGIRCAHALGTRWVEFDVKLTRDAVTMLMHDDTLERTTNGSGPLAQLDRRALLDLDASHRFAGHPREPVPSLDEALDLVEALDLGANVEVKPCPGREEETGMRVARTILRRGQPEKTRLLVSSFSPLALAAVRKAAPGLPLGLLVGRVPRRWQQLMTDLGCTTLHPRSSWSGPKIVRVLAHRGVPVIAYTVNQPAVALRLLQAGARSIITDAPDRLLQVLVLQGGRAEDRYAL